MTDVATIVRRIVHAYEYETEQLSAVRYDLANRLAEGKVLDAGLFEKLTAHQVRQNLVARLHDIETMDGTEAAKAAMRHEFAKNLQSKIRSSASGFGDRGSTSDMHRGVATIETREMIRFLEAYLER